MHLSDDDDDDDHDHDDDDDEHPEQKSIFRGSGFHVLSLNKELCCSQLPSEVFSPW